MIETLADEWRGAGVQGGDVLLLHTSIKRLFKRYREKGVTLKREDILESFLSAVGPTGTLLVPLFNFDFTKGGAFDIRNSPSHMGVLTELARQYPNSIRTSHPVYSFAAIGARAKEFEGVDNFSAYDNDSPFAILLRMNGRIASLDLSDQDSMTFYHHVEEMHKVDYRYLKEFTGSYTDMSGHTELKTYGMNVRDIDKGVITSGNPAGDLMWEAGLYSGNKPHEGCGLRTILAKDMYNFLSDIIKSGKAKNNLYRIDGE